MKRSVRVAARLREELANLIAHEIRDPRVVGVIVARVEMPDDLRAAKIFFRLLEGGESEARRTEALTGLSKASGILRREASRRLLLRHAPELSFVYDGGQEKMDRIESLLHEVREDVKRKP